VATKLELGTLERIKLRDAWDNESLDFTPWLAQPANIRVLGDALGLELQVEGQEQGVGPFRADIVCRNLADGSLVLIENQIERTDHVHLGQLLTYAAGLNTVTIIWVADRFTAEHRAALDWLNRITAGDFNFFGVEVELWRIPTSTLVGVGTSPAAPKFNIVCRPNNWVRALAEQMTAPRTATGQLQLEYWTAFAEFLTQTGSQLKGARPRAHSKLPFSLGRKGFSVWAVLSSSDPDAETDSEGGSVRAQITIEAEDAAGFFRALQLQKDALDIRFGEPLVWYETEDQHRRRIYVRLSANIQDRNDWQRQQRWLKERLERLYAVFAPIIKTLSPAHDVEAGV
jgi:hypothetical protein